MTDVTLMPRYEEWTADDLDALPDDGFRYELVDGVLLVSPSPLVPHQLAQAALLRLLAAGAPDDLRVLTAPLDVRFTPTRQLQPDLMVFRRDQLTEPRVQGVPLLAVEVLSRSTRATDLTLKRLVLEEGGVASYWLVDPDEPSLTVLELSDGHYVEVAAGRGTEAVTVARPFPLTVVPADLLR